MLPSALRESCARALLFNEIHARASRACNCFPDAGYRNAFRGVSDYVVFFYAATAHTAVPEHTTAPPQSKWRKFGVPALVVLLAAVVVFTITRNWNSWEGGRIEQVTDDAYVEETSLR